MDDVTSKPVPDGASAEVVGSPPAAGVVEVAKKTGIRQVAESSHELKALHGLRFLAAFCILFSHACTWLANFKNDHTIYSFGEVFTVYGMPLFFVLSGFVIHYNYSRLFSTMRPRWAVVEFLGARFARIYPLFFCFFLVGIAVDGMLQWYYHNQLNLLLALGHALTLTQSWVYIVIYNDRLILDNGFGLSWSLSTEFFFYFSYLALVLYITKLRSASSLIVTAGAISVLTFFAFAYAAGHRDAVEAFAGRHMNDNFPSSQHSVFRWLFYYSPYTRIFEFILGCLTAQFYLLQIGRPISPREAQLGRVALNVSLVLLVAAGFVYVLEPFGPIAEKYISLLKLNFGPAVPLAVLIYCVSRYRSFAVASFLSTPVMIMLGELSYSIYVLHTWTLRIFERPDANIGPGLQSEAVLRIILAVALTIILSAATYRLIEVPARSSLRKMTARRLLHSFGPREANILEKGNAHSARLEIGVGMLFVAMIGALAAYQFLIVPQFTPYLP